MFVVEIGSVITTIEFIRLLFTGPAAEMWFVLGVAIWLWFTVLFANFAEAMAEGRGKSPGGHPAQGSHDHDGQAAQKPGSLQPCAAGKRSRVA